MFIRSTDFNEKPSWTSSYYAMWYASDFKWWVIGFKVDRDAGVVSSIIFTKSETGEMPDENSLWFEDSTTKVKDIEIQYFNGSNCNVVQNDGQNLLQYMRNWCISFFKSKIDGESLINF